MVSDAPIELDGVFANFDHGQLRRNLVGLHVTGQNPHGCGFSGAIRAEKTKNLSPFDTKADIVDGPDAARVFSNVVDHQNTSKTSNSPGVL